MSRINKLFGSCISFKLVEKLNFKYTNQKTGCNIREEVERKFSIECEVRVWSQTRTEPQKMAIGIRISKLSNGMYFVKIKQDGKFYAEKFIIL